MNRAIPRFNVVDGQEPGLDQIDLECLETELDLGFVGTGDNRRERNTVMAASKKAEKEEVPAKKEKEAKPEMVSAADLAKEFKMTGRQLRIYLRSKKFERAEGRWEWKPESKELAQLRKDLAARGKEEEKPAAKAK